MPLPCLASRLAAHKERNGVYTSADNTRVQRTKKVTVTRRRVFSSGHQLAHTPLHTNTNRAETTKTATTVPPTNAQARGRRLESVVVIFFCIYSLPLRLRRRTTYT